MMKMKIRKTEFGFQYCRDTDTLFKYFPQNIVTIEQMKHYFVNAGYHSGDEREAPEMMFVDRSGKPTKLYTIERKKRFMGSLFATVDLDKIFPFDNSIVTESERLAFLKDHATHEAEHEAEQIPDTQARIKYYISKASEETKVEYQKMIDEKLTDDVLRKQCEENAKTWELPAEVIFEQ
jgi:hypothetical protein